MILVGIPWILHDSMNDLSIALLTRLEWLETDRKFAQISIHVSICPYSCLPKGEIVAVIYENRVRVVVRVRVGHPEIYSI